MLETQGVCIVSWTVKVIAWDWHICLHEMCSLQAWIVSHIPFLFPSPRSFEKGREMKAIRHKLPIRIGIVSTLRKPADRGSAGGAEKCM